MATFDKKNCACKDLCLQYSTDKCNSLCEGYWYGNYILSQSNLPVKHQQYKELQIPFDDPTSYKLLKALQDDIYRFVYEGRNLYIYSNNNGNGKTTWATNLMHQYFHEVKDWCGRTIRGVFVSVPIFLIQLKNSISVPDPKFEQFKESLRIADLVIWDDIAQSKLSNYEIGVLYAYIQERLLSGKSNIYTGTTTNSAMEYNLGTELYGRVKTNLSTVVLKAEAYKVNGFFTNSQ